MDKGPGPVSHWSWISLDIPSPAVHVVTRLIQQSWRTRL